MEELSALDLVDLVDVAAVHYLRKGFSGHVEVFCRIKGITLIHVDRLTFIQGARIRWPEFMPLAPLDTEALRSFSGHFQASVFDRSDLAGLDYSRIDSVFVRFEHLLYGAIARTRERPDSLDGFRAPVREELVAIASALPAKTTLLVRGLDVRSDDRLLSEYFFSEQEVNPELGRHGTRYLLNRPDVVDFMADLLRDIPGRVRFACPFVGTYGEYAAFVERYASMFHNPPLIPFVESPAIFEEVGLYEVDKLCIGLKDLSQFYFAADRANPDVIDFFSYLDRNLVSALVRTVRSANRNGTEVHLYQQIDTFGEYAKALAGTRWVPSMAAFDLNRLERSRNSH